MRRRALHFRGRWKLGMLLLLLGLVLLLNLNYLPTVRRLVRMQADNETSNRIIEAVDAYLGKHPLSYEQLVRLEKDASGTITAMQLNMDEANRLRAWLLEEIDRVIPDMTGQDFAVPVGNVLFPALFSGRGGNLPVRVVSLRSSNAEIGSSFTAAGINQTLHTVELQVSVEMLLLTPAGFLELKTQTTVPLAQTVIVGSVPGTLIQTGE
jgi:sporulation protein YunB